MKQCTKCKEWKDESEFGKDKAKKDGLSTICKECRNIAAREYRRTHREQTNAASRAYWEKHKAERQAYNKQYYLDNKEKLKQHIAEWRKNNPEKSLEYAKRTRDKSRDFIDSLKTPCVKCGEDRIWVIDFHHVDHNEKKFTIPQNKGRKKEDILDEVGKCVCLCRNCHSEFHYFYGTRPDNSGEALQEYLGDVYE